MVDGRELESQFYDCMPLFIALGDEVRLNIIQTLTRAFMTGRPEGLSVNEITCQTSLSRPAISHHLKILKDCGLVAITRCGTSNLYRLTLVDSTKRLMRLGHMTEEAFGQT